MELDQRNTNENHIQLKNIKFNCFKCCLVINTILEKASGPNFHVFLGPRGVSKNMQFSQWKVGCFGMCWVSVWGRVGSRRRRWWRSSPSDGVVLTTPHSFWVVVPDKDDGHGYPICFFHVVLCLPISFCWVVLLFSLLRWGGAAFSQGGAALLLLFLGVVVSSHNINKNIRSMLVRQKTLKRWGEKARKAKGKAPPSKGDLRNYPNEGWRKAAPTRRRSRTETQLSSHCHIVHNTWL